ncbi:DUF2951 family protein [Staphylococcus aureus]|uniref:DUF2951 family protein n=1 Tax=Staphylococcus aureus TaxID=1280 RepID=UPI00045389A2|nr:DUF2951 family protein [Staphylococcus aureus]EZY60995.1 hypothetical protein V060_02561 [Staphylococcus aureus R0294]EZY63160.1 hypothetical protein V061_01431 [Staphylococcus aureus R0353]EZY68695.1 hypothetical protein V063_02582 [Staphylococcus aureus R0487]EZY70946.1 hypothetical protein V064_01644 [Staphylococcus aureus R0545]EZY77576.1 hypothetical protein V066_02524 [Staphylococcus aureus R0615]
MFGLFNRRFYDHEWRIKRLEDDRETIFKKLDNIQESQKVQEKVSGKLDRTLDVIIREKDLDKEIKDKNAKNIQQLKTWILGLIGTILGSLIITILRTIFGI